MFRRKIILTENQFRNIFLTENRASKNQSLARKMVRAINPELNDKEFTEQVLHDIPNVRKADFHLYPAVVRFVLENGDKLDNDTIQDLNRYIGIIAPKAKELGLDQNANGMNLQTFFNQFKNDVSNTEKDDRENSAQYGNNNGKNNGYKIVPIPTFEKANEYSKYTTWCVTQKRDAFSLYTNSGEGMFYFLLKDGFENVPKRQGSNCPLDEYGLSMIAVSFRQDGSVNTVTCRWNHDKGGNDNIMSPSELSQVIGQDIYSIFNPNDLSKGIDLIYKIPYHSKELFLYRDNDKNDLFISNSFLDDKTYFKGKSYIIYNEDDGSNTKLLITKQGNVIGSTTSINKKIHIKELDDLVVINFPDTLNGSGIYYLNNMEKIENSPTFGNFIEMGNILMLNHSNNEIYLFNYKAKEFIFDEPIEYCTRTYYDKNKLVCLKNNYISYINAVPGEIIMAWNKITFKNQNIILLKTKENGIYVFDGHASSYLDSPLKEIYKIQSKNDKANNYSFLFSFTKENLIFNKNGMCEDALNSTQLQELFNDENTIITKLTLKQLCNEIIE